MSNVINFLFGASKSKTIILNVLTVVAGVVGYLAGHDIIAQNPEAVAGLVSALGVLNVILRFLTNTSVSAKVEAKPAAK